MTKQKKRVIILILWLILAAAIVIIAGYFLYTFSRTSDKGISSDELKGRIYLTSDGAEALRFDTDSAAVLVTDSGATVFNGLTVTDGVLMLKAAEAEKYFLILDDVTLFGDGGYFYLYGEGQ